MEQRTAVMMPKHSITYLGVCLAGVLIFIFVGIVPTQRSASVLDQKIEGVRLRIEEQKNLFPLYQSMSKQFQKKGAEGLSIPAPVRLPASDIDKLPAMVKDVAGKSGMDLVSVAPDLKAVTGDSKALPLNVVARGEYQSLRRFLLGIAQMAYLEHIEDIQVQPGAEKLELRLRLWIALS